MTTAAPDADSVADLGLRDAADDSHRAEFRRRRHLAVGVPQVKVSKFEREVADLDDDIVAEMHAFLRGVER